MKLYYQALDEFREQFYGPLLSTSHLQEGQITIEKVKLPEGGEDEAFNFWGYVLKKEGVKYLLSAVGKDKKEIVLKDTLPIMVLRSSKVSYRGEAYQVITRYSSAKFKGEQKHSFKEMVDKLTSFSHTNEEHYKLLYFMVLAQMYYRANFRVCSPPGFGKDSAVDTIGGLVGGASSIVQPSRAKLELRATVYNLLAINEASDIGNTEWENIQSFLLDAGAYKTSIEKQTRAFGNVGEKLDISKFSLLIMYNDIMYVNSKNQEKYIDLRAHKALLDRFVPFRLHGRFTEDFTQVTTIDVKELVTKNIEEYKNLLRTYLFYKEQPVSTRYSRAMLLSKAGGKDLPERWKHGLSNLLNIIDMYCSSQGEFNKWVTIINSSINDYLDMIQLFKDEEKLLKELGSDEYWRLQQESTVEKTYTKRKEFFVKKTFSAPSAYDWEKVGL